MQMEVDDLKPLLPTSRKAINSSSSPPPDDCDCGNDSILARSSSRASWWRKYSFFFFPVEWVTFLFLFGVYFQMQIYQQYYFQRVFEHIISNWTNVSQLNYSIDNMCLYQDRIVNLTSPESFVKGQKEINNFSMMIAIAYLLPSILVSPLIGTLSDQIGRKPALVFVFIGQLISAVLGPFIVYFKLSMFYFFIGSVATGLCGGFGIVMSSSFAYVTDITPKKWLTVRMAFLEASLFVATAISSASSNMWIQKTNCTFKPQVWVIIATTLLGIVFSLMIPESLPKKQQIKRISDFKFGFNRLCQGFKLFFCPSYIGINLWKVWIIVVITVLGMINETGNSEISGYFLHNKPLQWDYSKIGLYLAVSSVSHLLALVVILPIFVLFKFSDSLICLIGVLVSCGMCIFIALLDTTVEMFIVGVINGMQSIIVPSLRSMLARFLSEEDRGAAFALVAMFQLLATLIASISYNLVYTPDDLDNNRDNPKTVYWMATGIWGAAIPLTLLLLVSDISGYFRQKKKL